MARSHTCRVLTSGMTDIWLLKNMALTERSKAGAADINLISLVRFDPGPAGATVLQGMNCLLRWHQECSEERIRNLCLKHGIISAGQSNLCLIPALTWGQIMQLVIHCFLLNLRHGHLPIIIRGEIRQND